MDPWDPYNFSGMGSAADPFNYQADPYYSTQFAPTTTSRYGDEMVGREAYAPVTSPSQVPGTSGSPRYTPSATPGGVSQGDGTGMPSPPSAPYDYGAIPYGGLAAGLAGMFAPARGGGGGFTDKNM